jgi:glycine/D-amino acid oxidase-like deaminating enzyme
VTEAANAPLPECAEIVIIGGGAVGCGVAYSLAEAGKKDILLIERAPELGEVTTSQGAGLCGQARSTIERTRLAMHSARTFSELEKSAEVRPDWRQVGSLRIALTRRAADSFRALAGVAAKAGLEVEMLDPAAACRLWPPLDFGPVEAVLWCPSDGYMAPRSVVRAYEHQCQKRGVRFVTSTALEAIRLEGGRIAAVETGRGRVACRLLIDAAGAHAYHVARLAGLELPIVPVRHEYFISAPVAGLSPSLPCFRVPELSLYGRAAEDCLLLGGWEGTSLDADPRAYAIDEPAPAITPDREVLDDFAARFARLFPAAPALEKARVARGWPTFTPDGRFIIGESRRVPGFVMAGGCNAHGISGSAGIGRLLVESLFEANPSEYVRSLSPDRFTESSWDWVSARREARRVYETYYALESC